MMRWTAPAPRHRRAIRRVGSETPTVERGRKAIDLHGYRGPEIDKSRRFLAAFARTGRRIGACTELGSRNRRRGQGADQRAGAADQSAYKRGRARRPLGAAAGHAAAPRVAVSRRAARLDRGAPRRVAAAGAVCRRRGGAGAGRAAPHPPRARSGGAGGRDRRTARSGSAATQPACRTGCATI